MNVEEIIAALKEFADNGTKNIYLKHGAKEPVYGVKVQDLKKIIKKTGKNYELALDLYATGISDAMYLAGLMADETKITKADLQLWANAATWQMISEYTVPWIAAETPFGYELGLEWIESGEESIASAGWSTLSNVASLLPDNQIDTRKYGELLKRIETSIHNEQNRVRYTMNGFVIAVGSYIPALQSKALQAAKNIGKVNVFMGETACKVPSATEYINKVATKGLIGKKRKSARC